MKLCHYESWTCRTQGVSPHKAGTCKKDPLYDGDMTREGWIQSRPVRSASPLSKAVANKPLSNEPQLASVVR